MIKLGKMTIWHYRNSPKRHKFSYPYLMASIDIDKFFEETSVKIDPLSLLKISPTSYLTKDLLKEGIYKGLIRAVSQKEWGAQVKNFTLLTSPKLLGIGFNPVSFFYCKDSDDNTVGVLVEVNNTFKERHHYFLDYLGRSLESPKEFHVSPFNDRNGNYRFKMDQLDSDPFSLSIELVKSSEVVFCAGFRGSLNQISPANCYKLLLQSRLSPWLTVMRIHIQALILFIKGMKYIPRPKADHPNTIIRNTD